MKKEQDTSVLKTLPSINLAPQDWARATWRSRIRLCKSVCEYFESAKARAYLSETLQVTTAELEIAIARGIDKGNFLPLVSILIPELSHDPHWLTSILVPELSDLLYIERNIDLTIALYSLVGAAKFINLVFCLYQIPFLNRQWSWSDLGLVRGQYCTQSFAKKYGIVAEADLIEQLKTSSFRLLKVLIRNFREAIAPYLTDTEILEMQAALHPLLDVADCAQWSTLFVLAAYLGMHDEVLRLVENLEKCDSSRNLAQSDSESYPPYHCEALSQLMQEPQDLVFGLGSPFLVRTHFQRLNLKLTSYWHVRAWLAHTEYSALETIRDSILDSEGDRASELLRAFAEAVDAPEAVFWMLELMLGTKQRKIAREWLENHPDSAIAGLIPIAAGCVPESKVPKSRLTEFAVNYLRGMKSRGFENKIQAILTQTPEIADKVTSLVLKPREIRLIPFDRETSPKWLGLKNFTVVPKLKRIGLRDLPPIIVENYCLNSDQLYVCLTAWQSSTIRRIAPLLEYLKIYADPLSLDAFACKVAQCWFEGRASFEHKWVMALLAHWAFDSSVIKFFDDDSTRRYIYQQTMTYMRQTRGYTSRRYCVNIASECLRQVGTEAAMLQMYEFNRGYVCDNEHLKKLILDRQLTIWQIRLRLSPTPHLEHLPDSDKQLLRYYQVNSPELHQQFLSILTLDKLPALEFGARQFQPVIDSNLKLQLRDDKGKVRANLPKPNSRDDLAKVKQAVRDWKLLKKQIDTFLHQQTSRLEDALIREERWSIAEFESWMVRHPVTKHLVQDLVWGGFDAQGQLIGSFRVAEDRTYSDDRDEILDIQHFASVGIVHPAYLSAEQRANWQNIIIDYDIVQPFAQLEREIFTIKPEELAGKPYLYIDTVDYEVLTCQPGWKSTKYSSRYERYFVKADLTAVVGWGIDEDQRYNNICGFLPGSEGYDSIWEIPKDAWLTLDRIPPLVISEVLRDLKLASSESE